MEAELVKRDFGNDSAGMTDLSNWEERPAKSKKTKDIGAKIFLGLWVPKKEQALGTRGTGIIRRTPGLSTVHIEAHHSEDEAGISNTARARWRVSNRKTLPIAAKGG